MATELKLALRRLIRARMVTLLAVATLALGIGANSAIFTVVNGVLLRPLPFSAADELIRIEQSRDNGSGRISPPGFLGYRERARSLQHIAAYQQTDPTLTGAGEPTRVQALLVSDDYFETYGVSLVSGRSIQRADNDVGSAPVLVISEELWRGRFGGDENIIGKQVEIDGNRFTVVGVAPAEFGRAVQASMWLPLTYDGAFQPENFFAHYLNAVARVKPGVSIEAATRDIEQVYRRMQQDYDREDARMGTRVTPLQENLVAGVRTPLLLLLGAVGVILLIACANLANLLLANAAARWSEFAVRRSLGASNGRLLTQLLVESMMLALAGGAAGLLLGTWGSAALVQMLPEEARTIATTTVDARVIAFTAGVSLLAAILFGLAPALEVARNAPASTLRDNARGGVGSRRANRTRAVLVIAETALAVVLLIGAGLLLRSFAALRSIDPGFNAQHVLTFNLALPYASYDTNQKAEQFYQLLLTDIREAPGVLSAGATMHLPMSGRNSMTVWKLAEEPEFNQEEVRLTGLRVITPGYLEAMRVPLRNGRLFDDRDHSRASRTVLINEALAQRFFRDKSPIGQRIDLGMAFDTTLLGGEIVGVVGSVRQVSLDAEVTPEVYVPHGHGVVRGLSVVVRTSGEPTALAGTIREVVRRHDANLAIADLQTVEDVLDASLAPRRYYTLLLGTFAAVAMVLSALGLFGVISIMVAQRRREIGVRVALGAQAASVLRMIVGDALRLVSIGLAIGLAAAFMLSRYLDSLLFGVESADPFTFLATAGLLLIVALVASAVPAWNAARLDPLNALRAD